MILISSPDPTGKTFLLAALARKVGEEVWYRGGGALLGPSYCGRRQKNSGWDSGGGGVARSGRIFKPLPSRLHFFT